MHGPAIGAHASVRAVAIGRRRATYEDLCKVPDTMVAEIIDGELIVTPRPAIPHARVDLRHGGGTRRCLRPTARRSRRPRRRVHALGAPRAPAGLCGRPRPR